MLCVLLGIFRAIILEFGLSFEVSKLPLRQFPRYSPSLMPTPRVIRLV